MEALGVLPYLLPRNLTVFCLDWSGCGRSEGEYISLGYHEEKDLRVVLEFLRESGNVGPIALWGRSMGAATSILRAAEDHCLAACVLDSPFGNLRVVVEEQVNRGRIKIPQFIVDMVLESIRSEVRDRADFDLQDLAPIKCAHKAVCPALFGVASDDSAVLPHHTQDLHRLWAGEGLLRVFDGGHNCRRPAWFLDEAADFLVERLGSEGPKSKSEDGPYEPTLAHEGSCASKGKFESVCVSKFSGVEGFTGSSSNDTRKGVLKMPTSTVSDSSSCTFLLSSIFPRGCCGGKTRNVQIEQC